VVRLKQRRQFLAVRAAARRWVAPSFVLQAGPRPGAESAREIGLGFTASRRVGKAVARNRARRRLAEAARAVIGQTASPGFDYVIVARSAALTCPFDRLLEELTAAFQRIHRSARRGRGPGPSS